jgi:hypothetical protein
MIIAALCAVLGLIACDGGAAPDSPSRSRYLPRLPEAPPAWVSLLGEPQWRLEWLNPQGEKREITVQNDAVPEIDLPETWTSPVLAWPYWPDLGIESGVFRPAGALCPFDASGDAISLSWRGGVDAVLYWELARAASPETGDEVSRAASRFPHYFNWPRFREFFIEESGVNEEVRADPWLADWTAIAAKIVKSGFDKRRLVPEARIEVPVPVGPGPWIGVSPFAEPLDFEKSPVFPVRKTTGANTWVSPDTFVSGEGLLRCNREAWIFLPWE